MAPLLVISHGSSHLTAIPRKEYAYIYVDTSNLGEHALLTETMRIKHGVRKTASKIRLQPHTRSRSGRM
jgi:hypothetical protein